MQEEESQEPVSKENGKQPNPVLPEVTWIGIDAGEHSFTVDIGKVTATISVKLGG